MLYGKKKERRRRLKIISHPTTVGSSNSAAGPSRGAKDEAGEDRNVLW
jgi:hypothetical protein